MRYGRHPASFSVRSNSDRRAWIYFPQRTLPPPGWQTKHQLMHYVTAFSVSDHPFRNGSFPASGLIFIALGLTPLQTPNLSRFRRWWLFLFACAWTTIAAVAFGVSSYRANRALSSGAYRTVEGKVSKFVPGPSDGKGEESFEVNGIRFAYSDYTIISGFHQTASHGGPIREGLQVRIAYRSGEIIKLEVVR